MLVRVKVNILGFDEPVLTNLGTCPKPGDVIDVDGRPVVVDNISVNDKDLDEPIKIHGRIKPDGHPPR